MADEHTTEFLVSEAIALERLLPQVRGGSALERLRLTARGYGLLTWLG